MYWLLNSNKLSCSVNIFVLPTVGAPSDTEPLPMYSSCASTAHPNSPPASWGTPEPVFFCPLRTWILLIDTIATCLLLNLVCYNKYIYRLECGLLCVTCLFFVILLHSRPPLICIFGIFHSSDVKLLVGHVATAHEHMGFFDLSAIHLVVGFSIGSEL